MLPMLSGITRSLRCKGLRGTARLARNTCLWNAMRMARRRLATIEVHGYKLTVDLNDPGLSRQLFIYGDRERALGYILRRILSEGMRVLDVGGNIGYYPLMESMLVGPRGTVHVLEPFPPNFELLGRNVRLNGRQDTIHCHRVAALDRVGRQPFFISQASNLGTMFPATSDTGTALDLTGDAIKVPTVDLDTFLKPLEKIDLVRMDPEGAEVAIIRGLLPSIRAGRFNGRVITEIHASRYDETTNNFRAVLSDVFALGYRAEFVTSDNEQAGHFRDRGYRPEVCLQESNTVSRGIYTDVKARDVIDLVGEIGAMRDLVLVKSAA
ncbi:MAG: FkbM family methyltransferase [Phycisphaerae bacterium]|nr:FkbM family methyltransferase [Phycisphaerae bacterium]